MLEWTDLDSRAVDTARVLAMDAVEAAGNGHPGTAMALAPAAYLIFQRFMRHDPSDPSWVGRDRFVLSCGHSSLTLYTQLFYSGYGLELDDLKKFRTFGSNTPGHPEYGHTAGVEVTTGPLGQGLATAVGFAMAGRYTRGLLDPNAAPGESPFDSTIWVLASDGDLQEGVTGEASSLAGHQALGNLVVVWDDNRISIEGDTALAFSDDVVGRYAAYGWHTQEVELGAEGDLDLPSLAKALETAKAETSRPSLIRLRSIIAWPAPNAQNTAASHGAALGPHEVALTKIALGFHPETSFELSDEVLTHVRKVKDRGADARAKWEVGFNAWREANPESAALLDRLASGELPAGWDEDLPYYSHELPIATRRASQTAINALAARLPELWGGSADLGESNGTVIKGAASFQRAGHAQPNSSPFGRVIHFGIREHAMGSILNGIALHGLTRPFGGTFFVFSDYMRGAVRLGALMEAPVVHVWTHDSIGVGEDGPTHQPIEHLWSMRAIPNLEVVRPGDANETIFAWAHALRRRKPTVLVLTRQNIPVIDRTVYAPVEEVAKGAYVLAEASGGKPEVILLATGSEVSLALEARSVLQDEGIRTRVVSVPCLEWFEQQPAEYRESVLPRDVRARVSVEAGIAQGWWKWIGDCGRAVSLEHYGASGDAGKLFTTFGITTDAVVAAAQESLALTRE